MGENMKILQSLLLSTLVFSATAQADDVTYRKDIRPLWEKQCMGCHGESSPTLAEFKENKKKYTEEGKGPRMASYGELVTYVGWPDSGALMRRLDDGKNASGKAGNMYEYLAIFKAWVGENGWVLKRFKDQTKDELSMMKVKE
jgi:hypothetical protein